MAKKIPNVSRWGHDTAKDRYGKAAGGGVSQSSPDINIRTYDEPVEGTDSYYAKQEEKAGVPEKYRHYGDPVPAPPRRGRPLLKGK